MAGFGARILNPDDVPKFLNSPQTPVFDKGRLLYGLDRARKAIRAGDQVVIVEGYLDVIALHQAGFDNAVSPMGTALTEHQIHLLKRFTRRIVLALDPDAAGDKATLRGLQVARQSMDHETEPVFDARGLLGYEARLQADIRVTTLPAGMDPDEVVNRDPQEWQRIVENAKPVVMHVMETLAAGRNLERSQGQERDRRPGAAADRGCAQRRSSAIPTARVWRACCAWMSAACPPKAGSPVALLSAPAHDLQPSLPWCRFAARLPAAMPWRAFALGVLLRRPDLLYRVDRDLQKFGLQRISADDFQHADHQAILRLLQESIDQDVAEPLNHVLNRLSLPMMEVADDLLARTAKLDPNDERVLGDLLRALLDMRKSSLSQSLEFLRFAMEDSQQQGDLGIDQYQHSLVQNMLRLQRLDQARGFYTGRAPAQPLAQDWDTLWRSMPTTHQTYLTIP